MYKKPTFRKTWPFYLLFPKTLYEIGCVTVHIFRKCLYKELFPLCRKMLTLQNLSGLTRFGWWDLSKSSWIESFCHVLSAVLFVTSFRKGFAVVFHTQSWAWWGQIPNCSCPALRILGFCRKTRLDSFLPNWD